MRTSINPEMKTRIAKVIQKTWGAIQYDWCEMDPNPDYRSVCEACVDADRHSMYGEDEMASEVIRDTDYDTLEFFVKTLRIV